MRDYHLAFVHCRQTPPTSHGGVFFCIPHRYNHVPSLEIVVLISLFIPVFIFLLQYCPQVIIGMYYIIY